MSALAVTAAFLPGSVSAATNAPSASPGAVTQAVQQDRAGEYSSKVRGTFRRDGVVRGTFRAERFVVKRGDVFAQGVLRATLRRDGQVIGKATRDISIPLRNGSAERDGRGAVCDILNLVLGPLDLNLLGLEVHLNRVVLNIVANPGPGNLLGNLLCAVAGLLDGTGLLNQLRLSNLLNRILGLLG